jgi:hypothetical protein
MSFGFSILDQQPVAPLSVRIINRNFGETQSPRTMGQEARQDRLDYAGIGNVDSLNPLFVAGWTSQFPGLGF